MFDDFSWNDRRTHAQLAQFDDWQRSIDSDQLVVIEIGAGKTVPRIRELSQSMKAPIIRINPNPDDATVKQGVSIPSRALEALIGIQSKLDELCSR